MSTTGTTGPSGAVVKNSPLQDSVLGAVMSQVPASALPLPISASRVPETARTERTAPAIGVIARRFRRAE
ncbi:hypothetical protein [Pseudoxanthomonas gei]|uniref:hypothetical protein n=1 Tax=Pseudoxanthomonas gei TaxID=1383030 RepID=UPI001391E235|nr:hypothetical protein [Pseudoxanthomonas gei]